MNIMTQVCGIIILLTLIIFYSGQKKLHLTSEKLFTAMMHTSLVSLVLDVISLYGIKYQNVLPHWLVECLCKLYLVSIVAVLGSVLTYISRDVFKTGKAFRRNLYSQLIIMAGGVLVMWFLPIHIYSENGVMYTYGPSTLLTYGIAFLCICLIVTMTVFFRKRMNTDRVRSVLIWMTFWCMAALSQLLYPRILLVGFALSVGMVILYIKLENPGMNIDRQSGVFNQNAFTEYLRQMYEDKKGFVFIYFQLDQIANTMHRERFNWEQMIEILNAEKALMFRKTEDSGVLVFKDIDAAKDWEEQYYARMNQGYNQDYACLKRALWVKAYHAEAFADAEEVLYYLKYISITQFANGDLVERRQIVVDENEIEQMRRDKAVEQMIDHALEQDRVEVFYQPIFSTEKNKFTSAEALARIRDEEGNIVSPAMFIPIAERTGKIVPLGNIVFEKVCRFISTGELDNLGIEYIEVNLSPVQCSDETLADTYIALMEEYQINPLNINLEITESATFRRKEVVMKNITRLMEYSIRFSLDDFGTGHSNLNYIVDMPVDIVKFDRGMTGAFFVDKKAHYVVESAMYMIHGLGLKIVSEGIETKEQYETIRDMGISYIQGYYFSKPVPEEEFCSFVKQYNSAA